MEQWQKSQNRKNAVKKIESSLEMSMAEKSSVCNKGRSWAEREKSSSLCLDGMFVLKSNHQGRLGGEVFGRQGIQESVSSWSRWTPLDPGTLWIAGRCGPWARSSPYQAPACCPFHLGAVLRTLSSNSLLYKARWARHSVLTAGMH